MRVCPICASTENKVFMKVDAYNNRDHIELLKCTDCGFVFSKTSNCKYESSSQGAEASSMSDVIMRSKAEGISELVNEIIIKSKISEGNVLDFACGIGTIASEFKRKGYNVTCIEKSDGFRGFHADNNIISFSSLDDIKGYEESFDLIIMKDILEHLDNPVELLEEVQTFLKPGGYLYVRVPNRYAYYFEWRAVDTKSHINHFTPGDLKSLLKQSRLQIHDYIAIYDVRSRIGKVYNSFFWKLRYFIPMYHQISLLCKKG